MKRHYSRAKRLTILCCFSSLSIFNLPSPLTAQAKPTVSNVKIVKGFANPESVAADEKGERFFVSNIGEKLAPTAKDGDGFISELDKNGNIANLRFLPLPENKLNAPKGLAVVGNKLFVTDINRIVGFEL